MFFSVQLGHYKKSKNIYRDTIVQYWEDVNEVWEKGHIILIF